jgi:peptidoglycan/xylan/chitin deacetylase (PgdA/CDA1 family)
MLLLPLVISFFQKRQEIRAIASGERLMPKWLRISIAACFYYSGLVKLVNWWTLRSEQYLVILNYHRASGGDLRRHLLYLRRHYRILHLEAALENLYTSGKERLRRRDRRPLLALTFDDGYYDNYTHGFPLACEMQVPITIFLIPGYIESGNCFWWIEGDHLVRHAQVNVATIEGRTYYLNRKAERRALAHAIVDHARCATSVAEREAFLTATRKALAATSSVTAEEKLALPLTWAQVLEIQESGWVSFGAHTMQHLILGYLTNPAEIQWEIAESRAVLEQQLGHPVRTFAYPVGKLEHIGGIGLQAVQQAGYDWAVTTIPGFNTSRSDPYLLRRVGVDVNQHWLVMAVEISGVWSFFSCLCRFPLTLMRKHLTNILWR